MKKTLLIALIICSAICSKAQTAEQIIKKHIAAIGGEKLIKTIKSQISQTGMPFMGTTIITNTTLVVGEAIIVNTHFNGSDWVVCVTPDSGWKVDHLRGTGKPELMSADEVKDFQSNLTIGGTLYQSRFNGSKIEYLGQAKAADADAYKFKVTDKDGDITDVYVDKKSFYIIREEGNLLESGEEVWTTLNYSDFRKTDIGYVIPFKIENKGRFTRITEIRTMSFNQAVDPNIFIMPKNWQNNY